MNEVIINEIVVLIMVATFAIGMGIVAKDVLTHANKSDPHPNQN